MSMLSTLEDVVNFCWEHRRRRGFYEHCWKETAAVVLDAAAKDKLYLVESSDKRLIGVCIMSVGYATKTLHVHHIVCIENAFATFVVTAYKRWPGYLIKGQRVGKNGEKRLMVYTERTLHYGR